MADVFNGFLSTNSLIVVVLNDLGVKIFGHQDEENERLIFFIDKKSKNFSLNNTEILAGQFLFQFEASPKDTLNNGNRHPSRLNFPHDSRVSSYDTPTPEEFADFFERMNQISENSPIYSDRITKIFDLISFQREKLSVST